MMPWLLKNDGDKKPPKGFEKFFKKKDVAKKGGKPNPLVLKSSRRRKESSW